MDSSLERLQVKVSGMTGSRRIMSCNGRCVPLHPTGRPGEYVAVVPPSHRLAAESAPRMA